MLRSNAMSTSDKRRATYADLEALPDHITGEIIDGELYASPRPAFGHAIVQSAVITDLGGPFDRGRGGPGGWIFAVEPELHFADNVLVPDLAGWRRARFPTPPDPSAPFITLEPDWVCEILSPSTARLDRVKKKRVYAREGVVHCWLIDPLARTLEVYRLREGHWVELGSFAAESRVRVEPFDAIELQLADLFLPETPSSETPSSP
jgi:Uma2 family endonuclease